MKILVTGATGFIGKALCRALAFEGHDLVVISRDPEKARLSIPAPHAAIRWDFSQPVKSEIRSRLSGLDAVVHLAGESIVGQRWSEAYKKTLRGSRVNNTHRLISLLEAVGGSAIKVFISSSAIGYYGDRGGARLEETASPGNDFLSQLCQDWENALFQSTLGSLLKTRKVALRTGLVLGKGGGALEKMVVPFSLGLGGPLGGGTQWMSWIHLDDMVGIILECLRNSELSGAINCCSPHPVKNQEFTSQLAKTLHTVAFMKAPKPVLEIGLGEVSQALLSSQRCVPSKLIASQFRFRYPKLDSALQAILGDSYSLGYSEFRTESWIPKPIDEVFKFFSEAENLEKITPPWLKFHIVSQSTRPIQKGTIIDYRLKLHGLPVRWRTEIEEWNPPIEFTDTQLKGPYQVWKHTHHFSKLREGTVVEDRVLYRLPLGLLGNSVAGGYVRGDVSRIFSYRSRKIFELMS